MKPPNSIRILGVRVDDVTRAEALALVDKSIAEGGPHQIVTVNPEFVIAAQEDGEFAQALEGAALAIPDGIGIVWASHILGSSLRARVAGVEVVEGCAVLAEEKGYGIFLLGAGPGIAEEAAGKLRGRYPKLKVVGTFVGSPLPEDEEEIVKRIRAASPQLLFVAYGAPRQDKWISRNLARLQVPVAMGVGGTFDFLSGKVGRAPGWMQRLGLEWLYRLMLQPWRWRRMLALPKFAWLVTVSALRWRLGGG